MSFLRTLEVREWQNGRGKKASERASDTARARHGRGTIHRGCRMPQTGASPGSGASCCTFLRRHIAVELAEQGITILLGPIGQMLDEVLNLLTRSFAKRLRAAEI